MVEHKKSELQLIIRDGGLDMHLNEPLGEVSRRVLRALELGGTPPLDGEFHIYTCRKCGSSSPENDNVESRCGHSAPVQQEDEALVVRVAQLIYEAANESGQCFDWSMVSPERKACRTNEARAVLANLHAQGLMRTPADAKAIEYMKAAELRANQAEHEATLAQAQVRALTQKCEDAHMEVGRLKSQLGHAEQQAEEANATIKAMEATIRIWAHDAAGDPIKQAAYDKLCQVLATTEAAYKRALKVLAQLERELSQERANVERTREDLHLAQLRIGELTWVDTAASAAQKGQEG